MKILKKCAVLGALLLACCAVVGAQTPISCSDGGPCWSPAKVDIGGMFAMSFNGTAGTSNFGAAGDVAWFPFKDKPSKLVNGWGAAADLSYTQSAGENLMTGMVGPRYRYFLGDSWQVFGEALAGVARDKLTTSEARNDQTHVAYFVGTGLDAQFTPHFSIRFIEAGFERTLFNGNQNHSVVRMGLKYSF